MDWTGFFRGGVTLIRFYDDLRGLDNLMLMAEVFYGEKDGF